MSSRFRHAAADRMTTPTSPSRAGTLSVIAFGHPSDPRTFSGLSCALVESLRERGLLRREYSAKHVSPLDVLRGAIELSQARHGRRLTIRRAWMWSQSGQLSMSARVADEIARANDYGPLLEIGTMLRLNTRQCPHMMLSDMTVSQAREAGRFAISQLSARRLDEAERLQRERVQEAAHLFTLSAWTARGFEQDCGVDPSKITVTYAGSNLRLPEGVEEPRREREVLFVGIDWERKGGPLLLEAFKIVRRQLRDARLTIVGCSPAVDQEGVNVVGYLDRRDPGQFDLLARCYLRASCFCLPTLFDPFPNVIIEAASVGLPTVSIDTGSRAEVILPGVTGELATNADVDELADALLRCLRDPGRCSDMGRAAQLRQQELFTWDKVIERIANATRNLPTLTTT